MTLPSKPFIRFTISGRMQRDYILTPNGKAYLDIMGGNLLYAAAGLALWETDIGLISRVGEDYPQEWLEKINTTGFDRRGIRVLPESVDLRHFTVYTDLDTRHFDNATSHFSRLNLPYPKSLLGYNPPVRKPDSRVHPTPVTIRINDIPEDYFDATAAHICPIDFLSHTALPSAFRQGQVTTITLDPAAGYMSATYWDDIPSIVSGLTAFLPSEEKMMSLFSGRSNNLWEMAETIASYGCEIVVIKRKGQGQYIYEHARRNRYIVPAYPARVADPTGAGDAFCGGFLAGFRQSYDPLEAALYGNISASMIIEGSTPFYALDALPGLAKARLEVLRTMVRRA